MLDRYWKKFGKDFHSAQQETQPERPYESNSDGVTFRQHIVMKDPPEPRFPRKIVHNSDS